MLEPASIAPEPKVCFIVNIFTLGTMGPKKQIFSFWGGGQRAISFLYLKLPQSERQIKKTHLFGKYAVTKKLSSFEGKQARQSNYEDFIYVYLSTEGRRELLWEKQYFLVLGEGGVWRETK
jgi:hypothetical protein